jgi:hypothetical protein
MIKVSVILATICIYSVSQADFSNSNWLVSVVYGLENQSEKPSPQSAKTSTKIAQAKRSEPGKMPPQNAPSGSSDPLRPSSDVPPTQSTDRLNAPAESAPPPAVAGAETPVPEGQVFLGKRRTPGVLSPSRQATGDQAQRSQFYMGREPFVDPTASMLPPDSECPPSMPLCRFDPSQLKLVGVIQVDGNYKGMVEDPDGRGYYVTVGTQVSGATITQVNNRGMTLHLHRSGQDRVIPLYREGKEAEM